MLRQLAKSQLKTGSWNHPAISSFPILTKRGGFHTAGFRLFTVYFERGDKYGEIRKSSVPSPDGLCLGGIMAIKGKAEFQAKGG